jgi:hypothetical protein
MDTAATPRLDRKAKIILAACGAGLALMILIGATHQLYLIERWQNNLATIPLFGAIAGALLAVALYAFGPTDFAKSALTSRSDGISLLAICVSAALGFCASFVVPYLAVALPGGPISHSITGTAYDTDYDGYGTGRRRGGGLLKLAGYEACANAVAIRHTMRADRLLYLCMDTPEDKQLALSAPDQKVTVVLSGWGNDNGVLWRHAELLPSAPE